MYFEPGFWAITTRKRWPASLKLDRESLEQAQLERLRLGSFFTSFWAAAFFPPRIFLIRRTGIRRLRGNRQALVQGLKETTRLRRGGAFRRSDQRMRSYWHVESRMRC